MTRYSEKANVSGRQSGSGTLNALPGSHPYRSPGSMGALPCWRQVTIINLLSGEHSSRVPSESRSFCTARASTTPPINCFEFRRQPGGRGAAADWIVPMPGTKIVIEEES